ncbi:MAG: nickel pincer cofactor biosynthesis protein LarC [Synergistaceae bacterium]|nr:nickel pincer cofactor biosynthesis protein LarC [Synergistaceae bacterium]
MNDIGGKIIYLDANAGISGDMFLGAMTDMAVRLDPDFDLKALMAKISLAEWELSVTRSSRAGIAGLKVDVRTHEHHPHRHLSHILDILAQSRVSQASRERAAEAFTLLAAAEAEIHGTTPEEVHFHEVGAVDSIVDIVGAMLMMEYFGWPELLSSPVNVGSGAVKTEHGILPVPAPATAALLKGLEIFSAGEPMERTTPTGALLLRVLVGADGFRPLPRGSIICTGTGLGGKDTPELPNALRAILLDTGERNGGRFIIEEPSMIETNIDDMNPQDFALVMERMLSAGALDAWCENILMKKGRPAVKLCCLAKRGEETRLAEVMMRETTTIGVRIIGTRRMSLARSEVIRATPIGEVTFKSVTLDGRVLRSVPEYEDVLRLAREKNLSAYDVRNAVFTHDEAELLPKIEAVSEITDN